MSSATHALESNSHGTSGSVLPGVGAKAVG
jgi:hypothetical protein